MKHRKDLLQIMCGSDPDEKARAIADTAADYANQLRIFFNGYNSAEGIALIAALKFCAYMIKSSMPDDMREASEIIYEHLKENTFVVITKLPKPPQGKE